MPGAGRIAVTARAVLCCLLAVAPAAAGTERSDAGSAIAPHLAQLVHPGQLEARRLAREATRRLAAGDAAAAVGALERAVRLDPLLAGAWTNLSAAYIDLCLPRAAQAAASVARLVDPDEPNAATNLRLALRLDCGERRADHRPFLVDEELDALTGPADAARFVEAARSRRGLGDALLAALWEERAAALGADRAGTLRRLAADLERDGQWAAAARLLRELGDEGAAAALEQRVRALTPEARRLALALGARAGLAREEEFAALFVHCQVLLARGMDPEQVERRIGELLAVDAPREYDEPWGALAASSRWARVDSGAGASGDAPLLVLRRFPGDSQLAVFSALAADLAGDASGLPAALARRLAERQAAPLGPPAACGATAGGLSCLVVPLEVSAGAEGPAAVEVLLIGRTEPERPAWRIAVVRLEGDAGCGAPCLDVVRQEADAIVRSIRPGGAPPPAGPRWSLPIPSAWRAPRVHDEKEAPWASRRLDGLRIDFPPGLVVARQESGFRDPRTPPGAEFWFRGRFRDLDGREVVVGDPKWAGWVDLIEGGAGALAAWRRDPSTLAPAADPGARLTGSASLAEVLRRAGTGEDGLVAAFDGDRFDGRWLVHAVQAVGHAVVVVMPVVAGADSPSLSWIALTVRPERSAPPPPPVDLSSRRAVDFRRIRTNSPADPRGGLLVAEHLEAIVPRGFRVAISGETADGFPVTLRRADGTTIVVERLPPGAAGSLEARRIQASARYELPADGWKIVRRRRGATLLAAHGETGEGRRTVVLVVPGQEARLPAYRIVIEVPASVDDGDFVTDLVARSLRYRP
ncbi:MAG: hypothetical protein Kow0062_13300 [Acidobacteriota bacterium]